MFIFKVYVQAGGLISYGVDPVTNFRQVGFYVAKILNGAKPADLPVEQVYCGPVLRHSAELIQAANFRSAVVF
jgi:ABC-type uncharacterized transport system substrate-binding protein